MLSRDEAYYKSNEWNTELLDKVGINDFGVQLNSKFALDLLMECEKEYKITEDPSVFSPLKNIDSIMMEMMKKSIEEYKDYMHRRSDFSFAKISDV